VAVRLALTHRRAAQVPRRHETAVAADAAARTAPSTEAFVVPGLDGRDYLLRVYDRREG
jgi:putative intracellular protease/amidase